MITKKKSEKETKCDEAKKEEKKSGFINQDTPNCVQAEIHFVKTDDHIEAKFYGSNFNLAYMLYSIFKEKEQIYDILQAAVRAFEDTKKNEDMSLPEKIQKLGKLLSELGEKMDDK